MALPAKKTRDTLKQDIIDLLGFSSASANVANVIDKFLITSQNTLYWQYDFNELRKKTTIATVAGTTLYDWPDDVEPRKLISIAALVQGEYIPLTEGIDWVHDGIADLQYFPQRYDRLNQLEIWPQPDQVYTLHLEYYQRLGDFAAGTDVCTLDDELVFLSALVKAKARYNQADVEIYAQEFKALLRKLRVDAHGEKRYFVGRKRHDDVRPPPVVVE